MSVIKFLLGCLKETGVFGIFMDSGDSGGGQQTATSYQTNIPEYAREPYMRLVGGAEAVSRAPYQEYTGERSAQFTPMQQQAFQAAQNQQVAPQLTDASNLAYTAANRAMGQQYNPSQFSAQQVQASDVASRGFDFERVGAGPQVQADRIGAGQIGFERARSGQVGTQGFTAPGAAEAYMSPYMQNVVNTQQREAQRQADIARTQRGAQAVGAGAFGGSRQAIMEAEAARNLAQQKGDIQSQGLQSAYQQAQSMFTSDQARALQAQQANQQYGLQAQLANQQAGLTAGQTNLQSMMQAQQANQQYGMQAQLANQQEAQRAALANQQAGLTTGQAGLSAYMQAQLANQQSRMQAQQSNQQAGLEAQRLSEQSRQYGAGFGQQGLQTALQGAGQLGQLGQQQFGQEQAITGQQAGFGGFQQQQIQDILNRQYADFSAQRNYPYQQLGFLSDILRGTQGTTRSMYEAPPSTMQNLAGLGGAAMGIGKLTGTFAKGGSVKSAGLAELALSRMKG